VTDSGSTSLESHFLTLPLVFSTVPFCQGDCGSQNHLWVPMLAWRYGQSVNSAPVEGDRTAGKMGQGLQGLYEAVHNRPGLPIIVAQKDRKAADPLDKRRHIGLSELLAELDQIAFPMAELLAIGNDVWAAQDVQVRAKPLAVLASGVSWSAPGTMLRQMPPQLDGMAVGRIGELVDRLMAHRDRMTFQPHSTGDLLR
jgi:hypothetical protein